MTHIEQIITLFNSANLPQKITLVCNSLTICILFGFLIPNQMGVFRILGALFDYMNAKLERLFLRNTWSTNDYKAKVINGKGLFNQYYRNFILLLIEKV